MANPIYAPQQLLQGVRGTFIEALMAPRPPSITDRIATIIQSKAAKEEYPWLGESPALDEFTDQLLIGNLSEADIDSRGYSLTNKTYEAALAFKRDDLADEQTGGMAQRVRDLAVRAFNKKDALIIDKLVAGTSDTCYLGTSTTAEAFFTATHAARGKQSATWSNLLTGSGTTTAYCATDIGTAIAALYNVTDEAAEPLNGYLNQIFVLYPPALHKSISEAVTAGIVSQTSNVQFSNHNMELIMEPRLTATSADDYYVGIGDPGIVRGMIWQDREGVTLEQTTPGADTWVNLRQVFYAAYLRGVAGYGRPQRLMKVNN